MKTKRDVYTIDMFELPPKAVTKSAGCLTELEFQVSQKIAAVLREQETSRQRIADEMTELLGEPVTKNMLDAYSSPARKNHAITLSRAIAFDLVTGELQLIELFAKQLGLKVVAGEECVLAELGRLHEAKKELTRKERFLRNMVGK